MSELVIQVCPECDRPLAGVGTRVIDGDTICYVCAECHDHEAANAALEADNAALRMADDILDGIIREIARKHEELAEDAAAGRRATKEANACDS